jgi:2-aminoadipate transaminase
MKQSLIRDLVSQTKGVEGMISLAGGFPAPQTFPKEQLAELFAEAILTNGDDILQYGATGGDLRLLAAIKKWENLPQLNNDEMLISVGSTNAIYCYARALIDPGDVILCEGPNFLGTGLLFETIGAEVIGLDVNEAGIDLQQMEATIQQCAAEGKKIKFIYTIPEFQNPTGISMQLGNKRALVRLAAQYEIPILEDNPYGALRYQGDSTPDLYAIAQEIDRPDLVVLVKSFSKILGPGLRLAYAIGAAEIINKMVSWQQKINVSADNVTQRVVALFMEKQLLAPHIKSIVNFYRPKKDAMLKALQKHMPQAASWTAPEGGMFIWVYLPENYNTDQLFQKALQYKVAFVPGSKFYPSGAERFHELRLNFSYPTIAEIELGIQRLGDLLKTELQ